MFRSPGLSSILRPRIWYPPASGRTTVTHTHTQFLSRLWLARREGAGRGARARPRRVPPPAAGRGKIQFNSVHPTSHYRDFWYTRSDGAPPSLRSRGRAVRAPWRGVAGHCPRFTSHFKSPRSGRTRSSAPTRRSLAHIRHMASCLATGTATACTTVA